ncbi:hypothetical protein F5Y17DRAFT_462678 [Xylariaceae sp. FL0594]|nr:hypothetical protein F5Y17DRAFT_462678 [Xylariaceae sp. FL0594]
MSENLADDAWRRAKRSVDRLLQGVAKSSGAEAIYLAGPAMTVHELKLVDYVVPEAIAGRGPKNVIYVTATRLAYAALQQYVIDEHKSERYLPTLRAFEANDFGIGFLQSEKSAPRLNSVVFIIEVTMSATVYDEIMFGNMIKWLHDVTNKIRDDEEGAAKRVAVVLFGSCISERTLNLFRKVVATELVQLHGRPSTVGILQRTPDEASRAISETLAPDSSALS